MMKDFIQRRLIPAVAITAFCLLIRSLVVGSPDRTQGKQIVHDLFTKKITRGEISQAVGNRVPSSAITNPNESVLIDNKTLKLNYTIQNDLQRTIEETYKHAGVQYGAFVAIDPTTGRVLSMVSYGKPHENLALRATFPSASVFKIVTAAAAIEAGKLNHNSLIPVMGSYHTLYKQNLFKSGGLDSGHTHRYTKLISFADALAKSVNSVFGKVGIFGVGPDGIRKTAMNFAFNRDIPFDMPLQNSRADIPEDLYGIAESASGFTRHNTMSPLHGAMIASAVANNGVIMEPSIVESLQNEDGSKIYSFEPSVFGTAIDQRTAEELKVMLRRTVTDGTSRASFKGIGRDPILSNVYIGGKTGTLNGWDPPGRYDWFVGFAESNSQKIAVSALCIHGTWRGMKASKVARIAFENFFKHPIAKND